jgi:hypothetical protein
MSYNVSTKPSDFTLKRRIDALKNSMGSKFISAEIKTNNLDEVYVEVITSLRPSLRMFEACDDIMKPFNIILDHQTLNHYVLKFIY